MRTHDLSTRHFNTLDVALEDAFGQWLDRWTATDAVKWARRANADAINLMIINEWGQAYYHSKTMPPHPQLGGSDRLAEVIAEAHKHDLAVFGMWGPSPNPIVIRQNPDWAVRRADGSVVGWGYEHLSPCQAVCHNSPYGKVVLDTLADLYRNYKIDGVCFDYLQAGPCFCSYCRAQVGEALGLNLSDYEQWGPTDRAAYHAWRKKSADEFVTSCRRVSNRNKRVLICSWNYNGHFFFCEPHTGGHINIRDKGYVIRQEAAVARAHGKETVVCTPYAHQYYIGLPKPPAHMRQEFRQIMVSGDYKLWPVAWDWELVKDSAGLEPLGTVFAESSVLSRFMRGARSVPHVALINSTETLEAGGDHATLHADGVKGSYDVLTRAHIPVELVDTTGLKTADLSPYRLVILSDVACMSDKQAAAIRRFVRAGGNLIATYQTSLYDEVGRPRYDFALADVFGCTFRGQTGNPWSYVALDPDSGLDKGLTPGNLLLHGDIGAVDGYIQKIKDGVAEPTGDAPAYGNAQCFVHLSEKAQRLAEIFDTAKKFGTYFVRDRSPAQPGDPTGRAAMVRNKFGKGTAYYVAGQLDRTFYCVGHPDHERVLLNLMEAAAGPAPLHIVGPTTVEATYFVKGNGYLVHLLNHTYDQMFPVQKGDMGAYGRFSRGAFRPVEDVFPVRNLRVRIAIKGRIRSVTNALTGEALTVTRKKSFFEVRLPTLKEHMAVAIRFSGQQVG